MAQIKFKETGSVIVCNDEAAKKIVARGDAIYFEEPKKFKKKKIDPPIDLVNEE